MSYTAIQVEHLTKQYVLRHQQAGRYTAFRDVLVDKVKAVAKGKLSSVQKETFLALNDVSFSVQSGDRVGIIGRNGAGKSTLLKILSRIVVPTKGRITLDGRIASLLEVGTGFHPELSGRENIYLNGAILGMGKSEIDRKFDEIVAFAEVERFLDTPVKRYSSGMYVRLAFAVAAHLEPEILVVDEVLAVGDAAFQKKCLGRMREVASEGRTILFVSHNMDAIQRLCNTGILLSEGRMIHQGEIQSVTSKYLESYSQGQTWYDIPAPADAKDIAAYALQMQIENTNGVPVTEIAIGEEYAVRVKFRVNRKIEGFIAAIGLSTLLDQGVRTTWSTPHDVEPGEYSAVFSSDKLMLTDGQYKVSVGFSRGAGNTIQFVENAGVLIISEIRAASEDQRILNSRSGLILNQMNVQLTRES